MSEIERLFPVSTARASDGHLTIAGWDLTELASQYGTPLYVYDAATLRLQVDTLKRSLKKHYPADYLITYAAKAYFSLGLARRLAPLDLGVDVVSLGELVVAQRGGFDPGKVHLHGNNKSPEEMEAALRWGVQSIVVDSLEELEYLDALAARLQARGRIWLRITPGLHVDTHPYRQTAHPTSKFGLLMSDGQAAEGIRRAQASQWLQLTGLHAHLGSQVFEPQPFLEAVDLLVSLSEQAGYVPLEFSPGGGWGVRYTPDDPQANVDTWVVAISQSMQTAFGKRGWPLPRLIIEPGRFLVAQAGVALYRVGTTKTVGDGTHVVAIDGGMADNPRVALYRARYTALVANRNANHLRRTSVVGKFCESGDVLINNAELPEMTRGDLLAMPAAGAYQLSMSSNYNLAPRPAVLWLEEDQVAVLQPRETPEESGWWVEG
ncbi:MAG TPA: diaminopimelate decarboxylase [Anaerolineaceae bacterium]